MVGITLEKKLFDRLCRAVSAAHGIVMETSTEIYGDAKYKNILGEGKLPDHLVLLPNGKAVLVDVFGKTDDMPEEMIEANNELRSMGYDVRTLYGEEYVDAFCDEITRHDVKER